MRFISAVQVLFPPYEHLGDHTSVSRYDSFCCAIGSFYALRVQCQYLEAYADVQKHRNSLVHFQFLLSKERMPCDSRLKAYTPLCSRRPPFIQVIQHTHVRQKSLFHESGGLCKSEEPRTTGSTLSGYRMRSQGLWFSPLLYRAAYSTEQDSSCSSFCERSSLSHLVLDSSKTAQHNDADISRR